ncbi:acyltransferase ChoActase/COT/CPT [Dimargaris cristalligena]|uniref:Acyltransferase ChoActase/COT/CPT n=1 Tax=Dimargaris cristalligena TaxID=215637 RepID=A0A4P9ZLK7_9FUNG|nr:acyltransferase ChoActase/COT/CPT [Dimargaris cristalligena]|eukprot:RKP34184.1 acyltransferase ChoActase/COT/CPT [Dimargaris cristalligena]
MLQDTRANEATLAFQDRLPRLPVPNLHQTATKYLESLKPLLTPEEWQHSAAQMADFIKPGGQGETLQQLLKSYATTQQNWLDTWWRRTVYLESRAPLMINSNCGMVRTADPNQPPWVPRPQDPSSATMADPFTPFQIHMVTRALTELLNTMELIEKQEYPVQRAGPNRPLCMDQYYRIFGLTRIPEHGCDRLHSEPPLELGHVMVLIKGQLYNVPILADTPERTRLTESEIEDQLWKVVEDVKQREHLGPSVAILTSENRDVWAEARKHLCELSPRNVKSFEVINKTIISVSLDDYACGPTPDARLAYSFMGRGGKNRWFDKTLQVTADTRGTVSYNFEHSPCDAVAPGLVVENGYKSYAPPAPSSERTAHPYQSIQRIDFDTDKTVQDWITQATARALAAVDERNTCVFEFSGYGDDFVKQRARVSPNSYLQMVFQLAYYRLHGRCVSTYEPCSTMSYRLGRTETNRLLTPEVKEFVEAYVRLEEGGPNAPKGQQVYRLMCKAAEVCRRNTSAGSQGQGCDRHLFGLRMAYHTLYHETDGRMGAKPPLHPIFSDRAYEVSSRWTMCTANMPILSVSTGTAFGAVDPEGGYGVSYIRFPSKFRISLDGKKLGGAKVSAFQEVIRQTLVDMARLCMLQGPLVKSSL